MVIQALGRAVHPPLASSGATLALKRRPAGREDHRHGESTSPANDTVCPAEPPNRPENNCRPVGRAAHRFRSVGQPGKPVPPPAPSMPDILDLTLLFQGDATGNRDNLLVGEVQVSGKAWRWASAQPLPMADKPQGKV